MGRNDTEPTSFHTIVGDNLDVLRQWDRDLVDAVITDPPAGIGFMGKEWDHDRSSPERWVDWLSKRLEAVLAVMKPGAHALVWALPRTSHRTAMAIERAGFEIRDRHSHFFGNGFPKGGGADSVAKQIDRAAGVEPTVVGENPNHRPGSGVDYTGVYGGGNTGARLRTTPTSPEAMKWTGWSTALKPACEDWWLARKPFDGPVYRNVMTHGTGALNVDACRIPTDETLVRRLGRTTTSDSGWVSSNRSEIAGRDGGRWPAHISSRVVDSSGSMRASTTGPSRSGGCAPLSGPSPASESCTS